MSYIMNKELEKAIENALEALLNVPQVGKVYDNQQSYTHTKAYVELKEEFEMVKQSEEYDHLIERDRLLCCLEDYGVNNWEGYDDAVRVYHKES